MNAVWFIWSEINQKVDELDDEELDASLRAKSFSLVLMYTKLSMQLD